MAGGPPAVALRPPRPGDGPEVTKTWDGVSRWSRAPVLGVSVSVCLCPAPQHTLGLALGVGTTGNPSTLAAPVGQTESLWASLESVFSILVTWRRGEAISLWMWSPERASSPVPTPGPQPSWPQITEESLPRLLRGGGIQPGGLGRRPAQLQGTSCPQSDCIGSLLRPPGPRVGEMAISASLPAGVDRSSQLTAQGVPTVQGRLRKQMHFVCTSSCGRQQ